MLLLCPVDAARVCIEHASEFRSSCRVVRENRKRRSVASEALRRNGGSDWLNSKQSIRRGGVRMAIKRLRRCGS